MEKLDKNTLLNIKGGVSFWVGLVIVSTCIFLAGVIEGYVHPKKCN